MKFISILILILNSYFAGYTQFIQEIIPEDLLGSYQGQRYFRYDVNPEWTITPATVHVTSIDTTGCWTSFYGAGINCVACNYETHYYFCYGNSGNWFRRFYEGDSLWIMFDHISMPPPDFRLFSIRFYGKKNYVNVDDLIETHLVGIYPNPGNGKVTISNSGNYNSYELFDINGNRLASGSVNAQSIPQKLDFSFLNPGIYMIRLIGDNSIQTGKIVIH